MPRATQLRSPLFLIGAGGVGQLVRVRVDLDDVAPRILAVDHTIGFLARIVVAHWHALLTAALHDLFRQGLDLWVGDAEMENAGLPIFEVVLRPDALRELEEFDADLVDGGEVADAKARPIRSEHVSAHLSDGAVVLGDRRRLHDGVEAEHLGVPFERRIHVGHGQADVAEGARVSHEWSPSFFMASAVNPRRRATRRNRPISSRHMSMPTARTIIAPITTFCVEVATALRLRPFCTMVMVSAPNRVATMSPRPPERLAPPMTAAAMACSSRPTP